MFPPKANPAWPSEIIEIFNATLSETPMGCGSCGNAEWVSDTDSKGHLFLVALCRADIPMLDGTPKEFCTHHKRPPSPSRTPTADVSFLGM